MNQIAPIEMVYPDRELFLYRILSGVVRVKSFGQTIKIYSPFLEDLLEACEIYDESIEFYYSQGIKSFDEMLESMIERDVWSWREAKEMDQIKEKLEDLKLAAYENRREPILLNQIKNLIYGVNMRYEQLHEKKHTYFENTCEGLASYDKLSFLIKRCSFVGKEKYDFSDLSIDDLIRAYNRFHSVDDKTIRYLARNDPWRNTWALDKNPINNGGRELTVNQKTLLIFTKMYDNVHESMECPSDDVINDDDQLDGWFVLQDRKRKRDKVQKELDDRTSNEKIKNADEVFSVVKNEKEFKEIESLNSSYSKMIKKQRESVIKDKKKVNQGQFLDEKRRLQMQANNQYREKLKRG